MISKPSTILDSYEKEREYLQQKKDELDRKILKRRRANELEVNVKREFPLEFFKLYKLNEKDTLYCFTHGNLHSYILFVVKSGDNLFDIVELDRIAFTKRVLYTAESLKDAFNLLLDHVRDDVDYQIQSVYVI